MDCPGNDMELQYRHRENRLGTAGDTYMGVTGHSDLMEVIVTYTHTSQLMAQRPHTCLQSGCVPVSDAVLSYS